MSKIKYRNPQAIVYFSPRYSKWITVPVNYPSDGASGPAKDIPSIAWLVHDRLVPMDEGEVPPLEAIGFWEYDGYWSDGSACSAWQSTMVMRDILIRDGYYVRSVTWTIAVLPVQLWKQRHRDMSPISV
jgi:hypothetical protein